MATLHESKVNTLAKSLRRSRLAYQLVVQVGFSCPTIRALWEPNSGVKNKHRPSETLYISGFVCFGFLAWD